MTECIHGIEGTMCDLCYPKKKPEPVARPAAVRTPRTPTLRSTAPTRRPGPTPPSSTLRTGDMRVYHVTHVRNLPAILAAAALRADAVPTIDLSSELARELRATAETAPGVPVAGFVSFALAPDSATWDELRRGAAEPRWSPAARRTHPTDFVFLVTTVKALGDEAVIANGDAAATYTRFATTQEDRERMLQRLHGDPEARAAAEALTPTSLDLAAIQLIGVANEPVRDDVRALLADAGFSARVAVYPPWFAPE